MHSDPIVEEVRAVRDAYAKQFGYDLHAICQDLRRWQADSSAEDLRRLPRRAARNTNRAGKAITK